MNKDPFVTIDQSKLKDVRIYRLAQEHQNRLEKRDAAQERINTFLKRKLAPAVGGLAVLALAAGGGKALTEKTADTPDCSGTQVFNIAQGSGTGLNELKDTVKVTGGRLSYSEIPSGVYRTKFVETDEAPLPYDSTLETVLEKHPGALMPGDEVRVPVSCEA